MSPEDWEMSVASVGEMASGCIHLSPSNLFSGPAGVQLRARGVHAPPHPAGARTHSLSSCCVRAHASLSARPRLIVHITL